jgi:hypothetical protein
MIGIGVPRFPLVVAAMVLSCWLVVAPAPAPAAAESRRPRGDDDRVIQNFIFKVTPPVQRKMTSARGGQGRRQPETVQILRYVYKIVLALIALAIIAAWRARGEKT